MTGGHALRLLNHPGTGAIASRIVQPIVAGPLLFAAVSLAHAEALNCTPAIQYHCSAERCDRQTEGFQHAESFGFDTTTRQLSACLWTTCFSGSATVYPGGRGGAATAIGFLPDEQGAEKPPLLLSLTIDASRRFVAVWQYDGAGLTFDQGTCVSAGR